MTSPRTFISYSWSNPDHEDWVLKLASELRAAGVDAILDKWDLREGQEANAFMEKMVNDEEVKKVIMIVDRTYAEKSNARIGGAGTEAQIISNQLYSSQRESKFVALVLDRDDDGNAVLPSYYTSRMYIDFSDPTREVEKFEQLLRWIFDKPIFIKPGLGKIPTFLNEEKSQIRTATDLSYRRCKDAIAGGRVHGFDSFKEYLRELHLSLEKFTLPEDFDPATDEFIKNLEDFLPLRDQFCDLLKRVCRHTSEERYVIALHHFFNALIVYLDPSRGRIIYRRIDSGNFLFFTNELVLHTVAILIDENRFDALRVLLERPYIDKARAQNADSGVVWLSEFCEFNEALDFRKERLGLRRGSLTADLLKERSGTGLVGFDDVMQADFFLFIAGHARRWSWWPYSLVFARRHPPFVVFERAQSKAEFSRLLDVLGFKGPDDFFRIFEGFEKNPKSVPLFGMDRFDPARLAGIENLKRER